ncbi:hypothetical protein C8R44DRAFT_752309 [Mycena epipterygia]|nr:hypothetical protein C8R44DRAFT_752309 [Mycena epipterygia]
MAYLHPILSPQLLFDLSQDSGPCSSTAACAMFQAQFDYSLQDDRQNGAKVIPTLKVTAETKHNYNMREEPLNETFRPATIQISANFGTGTERSMARRCLKDHDSPKRTETKPRERPQEKHRRLPPVREFAKEKEVKKEASAGILNGMSWRPFIFIAVLRDRSSTARHLAAQWEIRSFRGWDEMEIAGTVRVRTCMEIYSSTAKAVFEHDISVAPNRGTTASSAYRSRGSIASQFPEMYLNSHCAAGCRAVELRSRNTAMNIKGRQLIPFRIPALASFLLPFPLQILAPAVTFDAPPVVVPCALQALSQSSAGTHYPSNIN